MATPKFQCATLSVPVSYSDPGGEQIPISVIKLLASRSHPIGDIVLNPGGPGGSGVQFLVDRWEAFPSLHARFNLVSFDPRGIGLSEPLLCLPDDRLIAYAGLNLAPRTPQQVDDLVSAAKAFVRGCELSASPAFLAGMSTANTARDMERLRHALGDSKLTYVGFSYGTYLGTVYAEMFPKHVRAMVLDGAIDPALNFETAAAEQAAGFESSLHGFLEWCAKSVRCSHQLGRPARAYAELMGRLREGLTLPVHLQSITDGLGPLNYAVAVRGVLALLYSKSDWPDLGFALATAVDKGDGSWLALPAYSLVGWDASGSSSNMISANAATNCVDWPSPPTLRGYAVLANRLTKSAPDFGSQEAWGSLFCLYWPARPQTHTVAPAHASGAPPILVVGSTGDPATPYIWAKALAKQLPRAILLTRRGEGHIGYHASSCIRKWANRYLETLKMPPARTVCPSD